MEERNAQIEKEDEEKKAEELKERKRKVLGMLSRKFSRLFIRVELSLKKILVTINCCITRFYNDGNIDYKSQSKLLLKELKEMKKKGIGEVEKGLNSIFCGYFDKI